MLELDEQSDIEMILKVVRYNQSLQQQAESSRTCNPIYCNHDIAEERLMDDYFGANGDPKKYPDYYFRRRYRMSRKLFLEIVQGANNDLTVLNKSSLFDNLLNDVAPIAPFEVNRVEFEKGYYLADGIYQQWTTFVKSFTVARDEKNALFKRRQKGALKDVERTFRVLQGRWHIMNQPSIL
uniref:Protein ALP1-like n=1 Tax=Tanacetum cinerariifolium TaxID=118510 RepID=A0A699GQY7_TANCI|nr:protein ALP1-like [Tanacetum cinerariifolium]